VTLPSRTLTRPNMALSSVDFPRRWADDAHQLAPGDVQVGPVEDVDARQVPGDQLVDAQDGILGARQVGVATHDGGAGGVRGAHRAWPSRVSSVPSSWWR
jgi:hypothetical protein